MKKFMTLLAFLCLLQPAFARPDRINGGEFVADSDPVMGMTVNLLYRGDSFCTGVLVEKDVVLSAAHCFADSVAIPPSDFSVEFFAEDFASRVRVRVKGFRAHPKFEYRNLLFQKELFDIAVLRLESPAPARAIPARIADPTVLAVYQEVVAAGFGRGSEDRLKKVRLRVLNSTLTPHEFLVEQSLASGICYGDSGGPTYAKDAATGDLVLVGINSHFWDEANCSGDLVLTSVFFFQEWIAAMLAELRAE